MKILITAGGTREDIDPVRGITNYATGKLGCFIAEKFMQNGAQVTYICAEDSAAPNIPVKRIRNTAQLLQTLETELKTTPYDCVIHTMAVSDYSPCGTAAVDTPQFTNISFDEISSKKISSDSPYQVVLLKRQPKAINLVKEIQPNTILVGTKLLNLASEEELTQAAYKQINKSGSDYVLANSKEQVTKHAHKAILINKTGIIGKAKSKQEIAELIYNKVTNSEETL